jgi:hypothetical protein
MTTIRHIDAEHVRLVLFSTKLARRNPDLCQRWAAMSEHSWAPYGCRSRLSREPEGRRALPPMFGPMERGRLCEVVERTRAFRGLDEVRRTWGKGLKAMRAETASWVLA